MVAMEEISLAELRRRTSAKWRTYPSDGLPLPVAEMDFPPAAPDAGLARYVGSGRSAGTLLPCW
jgi:cystathionine beta-lyase